MPALPDASRRLVAAIAAALAAVLLVATGVALTRDRADDLTLGSGEIEVEEGALPPPADRLPVRDLAGRVAPAAEGYAPVADAVSELGSLGARQVARLAHGLPDDPAAAVQRLSDLGLQDAYARAFDGPDRNATVLVLLFGGEVAARDYVEDVRATQDEERAPVRGALTYLVDGQDTARAAVFRRGAHAYQVTLLGDPSVVQEDELERLLRAQVAHVRRTG